MVTGSIQSTVARGNAALERGRGLEAAELLGATLRGGTLPREDEIAIRTALAEAWLLQDDLAQAGAALGRPPTIREPISDARLSALWRLHGRLTFARGEQSRAIALHARALKHAELAHDSRAIGLAHYELALCYKQVGDSGYRLVHLQIERTGRDCADLPAVLQQGKVLSAVYRVGPYRSSTGTPQGYALRLLVDPSRKAATTH